MIPDLPHHEVNDRLVIFQTSFNNLWSRYLVYSSSEELFGLTITEYPKLQQIRMELGLLQKLYGLYNDVTVAVMSYNDVTWNDVKIDKISHQLQEFNARYFCQ
jgi:dynein heavy chain, axonemal